MGVSDQLAAAGQANEDIRRNFEILQGSTSRERDGPTIRRINLGIRHEFCKMPKWFFVF